ncbi:MAG: DUF695 domain-containing protein [Muribaculaceae bacterium]|nr:DUF695 domain-containing protein [Muribaculaceae bacterium]MDE6541063.1 DUF695 domain-containing protein [Muribaculaceae bacterium]
MHDWWTAPAEAPDGQTVMVTGRRDVERFRRNKRCSIRVTVAWHYADAGMPGDSDAQIMGEATERLQAELDADPVAVMTGIYTGAGERTWVFYTMSTHIFNKKLNDALAPLPLLPLEISAESDPDWEEYAEMCECEIRTDD